MNEAVILTFLPVALVLSGYGLMWIFSYRHQCRRISDGHFLSYVLKVSAWVLLLSGMWMCTWYLAMVSWIAIVVILVGAIHLYRVSEAHALISAMLVSAEHDIPLEVAARSFARERHGLTASRARRLAAYLDAAVPLSNAMRNSRLSVPSEMHLAVDMGERSGNLPQTMRSIADQWQAAQLTWRAVLEKFFYLSWIIAFAFLIVVFIMIKIMPVFAKMFEEFELELPSVTQALIGASETFFVDGAVLFVPLMMIGAFILLCTILAYAGYSFRGLPLINRIFSPLDRSAVLRLTAIAVRDKRSVPKTLRHLSAFQRIPRIRRQLDRAVGYIDRGQHWCESLERVSFLRPAESGLLQVAERSGNLSWALDELAEGTIRRFTLRFRTAVNIGFPILILLLASGFAFVAFAIMSPLFSLIRALA